jgi:DNA (cytosine-5)-methyltransferase 1
MRRNHTRVIHERGGVTRTRRVKHLMRAIDLYSGIGGWALGLSMAGIDTVESYEWWDQANETFALNFGRSPLQVDIRSLPLDAFPTDVDIVVGSPPCTQFSFANRGGNGDIADGLKDVHKFLEVVDRIKPQFWAMENVPRVAGILERELSFGGSLQRFSELVRVITIVDMSEYGLPQRRRRMIGLWLRDRER